MTRSPDQPMKKPRIAIPMPHSGDREYAARALPQYENALRQAGGEPVRIDFDQSPEQIKKTVEGCDAVLLPGSRADVDPAKYGAARHEKTAAADAKRDDVDALLIDEAYRGRKPLLGICYGLQSLNVHRAGTLVQHIEAAAADATGAHSTVKQSPVNHSAGRAVAKAHTVKIVAGSRLAEIVGARDGEAIAVNSSHHQSAERAGSGLSVVARATEDGVIEALEGNDPDHFVLAVQWHPERSVNDGPEVAESAKKIFRAFVEAAKTSG